MLWPLYMYLQLGDYRVCLKKRNYSFKSSTGNWKLQNQPTYSYPILHYKINRLNTILHLHFKNKLIKWPNKHRDLLSWWCDTVVLAGRTTVGRMCKVWCNKTENRSLVKNNESHYVNYLYRGPGHFFLKSICFCTIIPRLLKIIKRAKRIRLFYS